jgi:hypothetical protein
MCGQVMYYSSCQLRERQNMKAQNIEKIRNEIRFIREDGKYWYIDINTGKIHGYSGKIIRSYPSGGITDMRERARIDDIIGILLKMFLNLNDRYYHYNIENIQIIEKLMNAYPYFVPDYIRIPQTYFTTKQIMDAAKELNNLEVQFNLLDICDKADDMIVNSHIDKYIKRYGENCKDMYKEIYKQVYGYNMAIGDYNKEYIVDRAMYYAMHFNPATKFMLDNESGTTELDESNYDTVRMVLRTIEKAIFVEMELTKVEFTEYYYRVGKTYKAKKEMLRNNIFKEVQIPELFYENEDFTVIIPTTFDELVTESNKMRNCISNYWLHHYDNNIDKKMNRSLVFIRSKNDPERPLIDCDITFENKQIQQYLLSNNREVESEKALQFKREYQAYLNTLN